MSAAAVRQAALARKAAGDDAGAARDFAAGLAAFPNDAGLFNSAGNFHAGAGRPVEALALFERALALMPGLAEAAINRAVVLTRLGRADEAAAALAQEEAALAGAPRYWTTRAAAELAGDQFAAAASSYDRALMREPGNVRALAGRARAGLELGEPQALARFEAALATSPGDPHLLRGYAQALQAAGRLADALALSEALATQLPGWIEGLELHATLRWAAGDRGLFDSHFDAAEGAAATGAHALARAAILSGVDRHDSAVDVLARARLRWPDDEALARAEAVAAGEAGDHARATSLFASYAAPTPDWQIAAARQHLRAGDPAAAEDLLAAALAVRPDDVTAWSLRDLGWRLMQDGRHEWLHGQPGLIRALPLELSAATLAALRTLLDRLHDAAAMPIGQSVKDGSQTTGALFRREEQPIAAVRHAVQRVLERYRSGLPPADPAHPLLRHRDRPWRIAGSWSIRLDGVGRHAAHIHPHGILSSAAYITVPQDVGDAEGPGCLELGRPPSGLGLALPALATIVPREGECALFPSTLFHGTKPIRAGRRMTVAFDVGAMSA